MIDLELLSDQQRRVLVQARKGPITQLDFDGPNVIDGGKPIKRVAARIGELVHKFGCEIPLPAPLVWASAAQDAKVAQYTLVSEPEMSFESCPDPTEGSSSGQAPAPVTVATPPALTVPEEPGQATPPGLFDLDDYRASSAYTEAA